MAEVGAWLFVVGLAPYVWTYSREVVFSIGRFYVPNNFYLAILLLGAGGIIAALLTIAAGFLPWVELDSSAGEESQGDFEATSRDTAIAVAGWVALVGTAVLLTYVATLGGSPALG